MAASLAEEAVGVLVDPAPFGAVPLGGVLTDLDPSFPSPVQALLSGDIDPIEHLIVAQPYDPVAQQRVSLYIGGGWASNPGDSLPTGEPLPNQVFLELLDKPPSRETHLLSTQIINESSVPTYGDVTITDALREFLPTWRSYVWDQAPIWHYQGDPSWNLSGFATTFRGEASQLVPAVDNMTATIQVLDLIQRLQKPIETKTYVGLGACVKGDGATGRLTFGSSIDLSSSWSMRFRIWPQSATNSFSRMWNKDNGTSGWLAFLQSQNLSWLVRGGASVSTVGNPILPGIWNDVFLTYDGSTHAFTFWVAYDDVELIATESFTYTTAAPASGSLALAFGARSDGGSPYNGRWGHIALFNVCLTPAEVDAYRSKPLLGNERGLVEFWPCTEATGSTVYPTISTVQGALAGGIRWAGSLTGTSSVQGKTRAGGMGYKLKFEPVVMDDVDLVYEIAFGGMVGVLIDGDGYQVEDRGIRPYTYAGDFADPYVYDPAPGEWISINAMGMIRLGDAPVGRLQVSAQVTPETSAGPIINKLGLKAGLSPQEIDLGALSVLPSYDLQIAWGLDSATFDQMIVLAAKSAGAWRTVSIDGMLTAAVFGAPSTNPVASLTDADLLSDAVTPVDVMPAVLRVEVQYAEYLSQMSATDLAPTATQAQIQDYGQQFRTAKTRDNASALKADAAAAIITRTTALIHQVDAQVEADREAAFRSVQRYTDQVGLFYPRHDLVPGMTVLITGPVSGYDGGALCLIGGKVIDDATQGHVLEVWR